MHVREMTCGQHMLHRSLHTMFPKQFRPTSDCYWGKFIKLNILSTNSYNEMQFYAINTRVLRAEGHCMQARCYLLSEGEHYMPVLVNNMHVHLRPADHSKNLLWVTGSTPWRHFPTSKNRISKFITDFRWIFTFFKRSRVYTLWCLAWK